MWGQPRPGSPYPPGVAGAVQDEKRFLPELYPSFAHGKGEAIGGYSSLDGRDLGSVTDLDGSYQVRLWLLVSRHRALDLDRGRHRGGRQGWCRAPNRFYLAHRSLTRFLALALHHPERVQ